MPAAPGRGGPAPLRSDPGPPPAGHAGPAEGGRARPAAWSCTTSSPTAGPWGCSGASSATLYAAARGGAPPALPDLPDPVRRLRRLAAAAGCRGTCWTAQLAYWRRQLADAPPGLELPTDRPRPAVQTFRGAHRTAHPAAGRSHAALEALSRAGGRHPLHDPPGGLPGPAAPLHRAGGHRRGHPDRQPHPRRDRGADRLLRQHPGPARPISRATRRSGSCWAGCARCAWRPTPTRSCPSRSWWRSCSRSAP